MWARRDPKQIIADYQHLISSTKESVEEYSQKRILYEVKDSNNNYNSFIPFEKAKLKLTAFSDTIIITAAVQKESMLSMLIRLFYVLSKIIIEGFKRKFHFRGCISLGEYYHTEELIIGPAVDQAAQYYTMPEWIGISAAPSTNLFLRKIFGERTLHPTLDSIQRTIISTHFKIYDIPIKNGVERKGMALNWMATISASEDKGGSESINELEEIHKEILKKCEDPDVNIALKWRNTLDFFDSIIPKNSRTK